MRRSSLYKNRDVTDEDNSDDDDDDDDDEEEEEEEEESSSGENIMMKRSRGVNDVVLKRGSSSSSIISCQAENCSADMSMAKRYHQRHKVCEYHAKVPTVRVAALWQRFCQQCSRFHDVAEFDETKRSCRKRLAGHNQRRRKSSYDPH